MLRPGPASGDRVATFCAALGCPHSRLGSQTRATRADKGLSLELGMKADAPCSGRDLWRGMQRAPMSEVFACCCLPCCEAHEHNMSSPSLGSCSLQAFCWGQWPSTPHFFLQSINVNLISPSFLGSSSQRVARSQGGANSRWCPC